MTRVTSGQAERDIAGRDDIQCLVRSFYARAFEDPLLGPVFVDVAHMDLDAHLPVMCDFWETVLFRAGLYRRNALRVHADLHATAPLTAQHFDRWITLWNATVDDLFVGEKAALAKLQAARIAQSIGRRLLGESGSEYVTVAQKPSAPAGY